MFGVGLEEFIAIIMVALIVLGPERLPIAMRTVGRWVRRLRDMSREFRKEFAEEFAFIQEEMSELRKEADATRSELADIRRELGQTVQETADDVTSLRDEVVSDVQGAVDAVSGRDSASKPSSTPPAEATANGAAATDAPRSGAAAPSLAPNAADAMALAISETFSANGASAADDRAVEPAAPPEIAPASDAMPARLEAFAPDVGEPARPSDLHPAAPVLPPPPRTPSEAPAPAIPAVPLTSPDAAPSVGIARAPEPGLRNQLGGFMRLIIMKALESDSAFRAQAEEALRAQARADAASAVDGETPDILDLVDVWVRQRRQLVAHDSVTVEQKAPESAVIELSECPYGLTTGDAHPVCDVSNVYDTAFFENFNVTSMYAARMSDGDAHCKLLVVTNKRLKAVEEGAVEAEEPAPPAS